MGRSSRAGIRRSPVILLGFALAVCWYAYLVAVGSPNPFTAEKYGLTFNSMLLHLLQGRFDVDPAVIGDEGYLRDGAVYAYFGIFPALFRVLFLPLHNFATLGLTRTGCLAAAVLTALFKTLALLLMWRRAGAPRSSQLLTVMLAVVLMTGVPLQFLRPSIYQETELWAGAFAAAFVYLVLRGWTSENGFTPRLLSAMAAVAGLCLLTRVSTALGLYLALGCICLRLAWADLRSLNPHAIGLRLRQFLWPTAILVCCAAVTFFINEQRWGNPLVFVDLTRSIKTVTQYADRFERERLYGDFNPIRLGYGLFYYFLPVWILRDGSGQLLWQGFAERTLDSAELPPAGFLVTDPLLLGLAVCGILYLIRDRALPRRGLIGLTGLALSVPAMLMLIAVHMTFRYRMEFYPLFELFGFIGFGYIATAAAHGRGIGRWTAKATETVVAMGALWSIVVAHGLWFVYVLSPFGPAWMEMHGAGVIEFYRTAPF